MIKLKNKVIDDYGQVAYTAAGLVAMLYRGEDIKQLTAVDEAQIQQFNQEMFALDEEPLRVLKDLDIDILRFDYELQKSWIFPEEAQTVDLLPILLEQCKTDIERERVEMEWQRFEKANWGMVLRLLYWLVEVMRENNVVWGVGRGSSVSSFVLYLIGVHKINPLVYNLSFDEFMRPTDNK
jgi:DNA polymerase III alpha subunit